MAFGSHPSQRTNWLIPGLFAAAALVGLALLSGVIPVDFGGTDTGELAESDELPLDDAPPFGLPPVGEDSAVDGSGTEADVLASQSEPVDDPLANLDLEIDDSASKPKDGVEFWNTHRTGSPGLGASPYDAQQNPGQDVAGTENRNTSRPYNNFKPAADSGTGLVADSGFGPGAGQDRSGNSDPFPGFHKPGANISPGGMRNPGMRDPQVVTADQTGMNTLPPRSPRYSMATEHEAFRNPVQTVSGTSTAAPTMPAVSAELQRKLDDIDMLIARDKIIEAHRELSRIYWTQPESRDAIAEVIDMTSRQIFFDKNQHFLPARVVKPGERLGLIAKEYDLTYEYLTRLNRIANPSLIQIGQELKVIKGPFGAVVDLSRFEITIHCHNYFVRRYKIGIGRDGNTPVGEFTIMNKAKNPSYTAPDGTVVSGDDPSNPIGERWLSLGTQGTETSFGIHGTIDPHSIGKAESAGCVRMNNREVEVVYDLLDIGSPVIIRR